MAKVNMTTECASTSRPVSKNVHVQLDGEVSLSDIADLKDRMTVALENQQAMLIDCGNVTYIDTTALQFLANLRVEARMLGMSLQIQGLPGSVLADAGPRSSNALDALAG